MPRFLIIRLSSIGDVVLTTPVVRCVKQQVLNAEVHFLIKHSFAPILQANPYIDKLHTLEDDLDSCVAKLKNERFDYIIDLHRNVRTLKIKRALGVKSFSFNKLNIRKWLLTALKINTLPNKHIVDRYLDTVFSFGVKNDGAGLDYFIPKDAHIADDDIPHGHISGYIGLVIGAAHATKKLPLAKLRELCEKINYPIILIGGPEDGMTGEKIAHELPNVYNSCGKFSLHESADIVRRARLVITHDTGLMHIAAAFGKPVISVWGNTVPSFGMTPYYGKHVLPKNHTAQVNGLWCRPCSKIGYKSCPLGHFKCMNMQDLDTIAGMSL